MLVFFIRRLMQSVVVVALMSIIVFCGIFMIGNPIDTLISPEATQLEYEETVRDLGLDKPLHQQYFIFLKNVLRGDFGKSFVFNESAIKVILTRLPATLELATSALIMAVILGVPLGLYAGIYPHKFASKTIMNFSVLGFSLPSFWVGLMLIFVFAVQLGWLPASGRGTTTDIFGVSVSFLTIDGLRHIFLPALNLGLMQIAMTIRLVKADTLENMQLDYVKYAKVKGLHPLRIVCVHVLKNILIPLITVLGMQYGLLIAFAVVTETIFAWPGMGKLIIDSINILDRPVIVAYLMITVFMFITINFIVDILYSVLDPRIRLK